MPLTDVFLKKTKLGCSDESVELVQLDHIKLEGEKEPKESEIISVNILHSKNTKRVVYAEAGADFVEVLLSFLTFPLGAIVKLFNKQSSLITCVDNLYHSVEELVVAKDYIKSEKCKDMLLAPTLYSHFDCRNSLLRIGVNLSKACTAHGCETCWGAGISTSGVYKCKHSVKVVGLTEMNPKLPISGTETGGGYAKKSAQFMVTSEMAVKPNSPFYGFDVIKELKQPFSSFVQKEVMVGEAEFLNLLRACLISRTPLSDVFSSKRQRIL